MSVERAAGRGSACPPERTSRAVRCVSPMPAYCITWTVHLIVARRRQADVDSSAVATAPDVQTINEVYAANTVREPWQSGDLLIMDNIRTAHSREPFEGKRDLLVAMSDPKSLAF